MRFAVFWVHMRLSRREDHTPRLFAAGRQVRMLHTLLPTLLRSCVVAEDYRCC